MAKTFSTQSLWKADWEDTRQHFLDWWDRKGFIVSAWNPPQAARPHADVPEPAPPASIEARWTDPAWRAQASLYQLARTDFVLDCYPRADTNIGPGSLANFLGCDAGFAEDTVWYEPVITDDRLDEPLRFDPENRWWKTHEAVMNENLRLSDGHYFVGQPDLIENLDTLASLRGSEQLMFDLVERPDWVKRKLSEIGAAWFDAFERIYLWSASATAARRPRLSASGVPAARPRYSATPPRLYRPTCSPNSSYPASTEQCAWLDYSMYHLDGTQAIRHLDLLLGIDDLDAVEWTPQAGLPDGGSPEWYGLYRRILEAGKSLQAIGVKPDEVVPLIEAVGSDGLYISLRSLTAAEARDVAAAIAKYR